VSELAKTAKRGWSYSAGWSVDCQAFLARAWKPRPKPYRTVPYGAILLCHTLSATGASIDEAAERCAVLVAAREVGAEDLSEYERKFAGHVAGWKPR
jgi:hypothetical protein